MYVYKTTNLINGKAYIGMHVGTSPSYMGSGVLLRQAVQKYGKKNFKTEILQTCSSLQELRLAEAKWITETNAVNDIMYYNMIEGGQGGDTGFKDDTDMSKVVKQVWDNYTEEQYKERCKIIKESAYDRSGKKNPKAKSAIVNGKKYECLKDALIDYSHIPYSTLKRIAQKGSYNKKYDIEASYA